MVEVTQADREAAYRWFGFKAEQRLTEIEKGEVLKMGLFLARHRITHSPSPAEAGQETVERVDDVARILFDQRQTPHVFDEALNADLESDEGALLDICRDDARAVLRHLSRPSTEAEALAKALDEALTPSGDTKAAYMGEFAFNRTEFDEFGDEHQVKTYVPWTTIKEIMAAIRSRAAYRSTTGAPQVKEGGDA